MILCVVLWKRGYLQRLEGFRNTDTLVESPKENPIISLVGKLKRMSAQLLDVNMWKERIEMTSMSPADLARRYIRQQLDLKKQKPE